MIEGGSIVLNNSVLTTIYQKAVSWVYTHALVFTPQKYELIHFIYRRDTKRFKDKMLDLTLYIRDWDQVVRVKQHARYLGV